MARLAHHMGSSRQRAVQTHGPTDPRPADARRLAPVGAGGLARFESLLGARAELESQERRAQSVGEPGGPLRPEHRPFMEEERPVGAAGGVGAQASVPPPRGLGNLRLVSAERLTWLAAAEPVTGCTKSLWAACL